MINAMSAIKMTYMKNFKYKIFINKGCFDTRIGLVNDKANHIQLNTEDKRLILIDIINNIPSNNLNEIIEQLSYYLKPYNSDCATCFSCGDENSYEEFEL